jgi:hypothetical protein
MEAAMENNYKYDLFISYYHEDEKIAKKLFEKMEACGLDVFWSPKKLERGEGFPAPLQKAVLSSQHFALYWSPNTHKSRWVSQEADLFLNQCHVPDKEHRRMYVYLDPKCNPEDLLGLYRDLNRSNSPDALVNDVVKHVLTDSRQQCQQAKVENKERLSQRDNELHQAKRKVEEAQHYYGYNRFWGPISISDDRHVHIFNMRSRPRIRPNKLSRPWRADKHRLVGLSRCLGYHALPWSQLPKCKSHH